MTTDKLNKTAEKSIRAYSDTYQKLKFPELLLPLFTRAMQEAVELDRQRCLMTPSDITIADLQRQLEKAKGLTSALEKADKLVIDDLNDRLQQAEADVGRLDWLGEQDWQTRRIFM